VESPLAACGFAVFALAVQAHGGFIHVWGIGEIDDSPALVVGTVLGVEQKEALPPGLARSKPPEQNWEATLKTGKPHYWFIAHSPANRS
jgi:hypothetical protein